MVKYISENLLEIANSSAEEIVDISCKLCNCKVEIPDGRNVERFYSDNLTFYQNIYPHIEFRNLWSAISASNYPEIILRYAVNHILVHNLCSIYVCITKAEIYNTIANNNITNNFAGIRFYSVKSLNEYFVFPVITDSNIKERIEEEANMLSIELKNNSYRPGRYTVNYTKEVISDGTNFPLFEKDKTEKIQSLEKLNKAYNTIVSYVVSLEDYFFQNQQRKKNELEEIISKYRDSYRGINIYIKYLLEDSLYPFIFPKKVLCQYDETSNTVIVDYTLPNKDAIPNETISKGGKWIELAISKQKKLYDDIIYAIVIRSLAEICHYDEKKYINHICFNGKIKDRSPITGQMEEKYILSVNVSREQIESINLEFINPKECFKYLKGVSASKLYEQTEIRPIITPSFSDKRIVKAREVETVQSTNLAAMDWEEFEHLVRQVFEWEFSDKGGEVNVTQSSRDGGVDAIVFDPDPIRGGKIIIQAKRYTNTVPVSAIRDLYGTIINEGANKGILITTSDYGPDSYKFAQGKPITLLNGGHLLYLMEKHGRHARIDIQEAKENRNGKENKR